MYRYIHVLISIVKQKQVSGGPSLNVTAFVIKKRNFNIHKKYTSDSLFEPSRRLAGGTTVFQNSEKMHDMKTNVFACLVPWIHT